MNKRQAKKFYHKQLMLDYVKTKFLYENKKMALNSVYGLNNMPFVYILPLNPELMHAYSKVILRRGGNKRFIDRIETLYPRETRKLKRKGYV